MEELTLKQIFKLWLIKKSCNHEWERHFETNTFSTRGHEFPTKIEYTIICKKCGKINKIKV